MVWPEQRHNLLIGGVYGCVKLGRIARAHRGLGYGLATKSHKRKPQGQAGRVFERIRHRDCSHSEQVKGLLPDTWVGFFLVIQAQAQHNLMAAIAARG